MEKERSATMVERGEFRGEDMGNLACWVEG